MAYDAKAVANYILDLATVDGEAVSPMKLQKLIYYAHGWHLALTGEPLITDEIEAWGYGPVVPSIYRDFKSFGNEPITSPAQDFSWRKGKVVVSTPEIPTGEAHETSRQILRRVWSVYKDWTALQLSKMTHAPNAPWSQVVAPYGGKTPISLEIPNDLIRNYFAKVGQAVEDE
jgi:uncharacterized phage-associated protein